MISTRTIASTFSVFMIAKKHIDTRSSSFIDFKIQILEIVLILAKKKRLQDIKNGASIIYRQ